MDRNERDFDPCLCITNFRKNQNPYRDIRTYFREVYDYRVKEITINKQSIKQKKPTGTVIVSFQHEIDYDAFVKGKMHNINGRTVKIRPFNLERKSLNVEPLVMDMTNRPDADHALTCPMRRLNWDCWSIVFSLLNDADIRLFGRSCSCAYLLQRTHEQLRRRVLSFTVKPFHTKGFFCTGCSFFRFKRYMLRFNLDFVQSLTLDLYTLASRQMDYNFCAFIGFHCPQLQELHLDNISRSSLTKQEMCGGSRLQNLQSLTLSSLNESHFVLADHFIQVLIAAPNVKNLVLKGCEYERVFFGALPRGVEVLYIDGKFHGLPTDVIANRLGSCLKSLTINIYAKGDSCMESHHDSFLKFTELEELSLMYYPFYQDSRSETVFTPPKLRRLTLYKPRCLCANDISLIGTKCPDLTYLYVKKPCQGLSEVDFRKFTKLEELRIPMSGFFDILTGKFPKSLRRLHIPMKEHFAIGLADCDQARPPVHKFFRYIMALPHLEFLETGPIIYPTRTFLMERIAERPPNAPFITLVHGAFDEDMKERTGDRYKFLEVKPKPVNVWEESVSLMTAFA